MTLSFWNIQALSEKEKLGDSVHLDSQLASLVNLDLTN